MRFNVTRKGWRDILALLLEDQTAQVDDLLPGGLVGNGEDQDEGVAFLDAQPSHGRKLEGARCVQDLEVDFAQLRNVVLVTVKLLDGGLMARCFGPIRFVVVVFLVPSRKLAEDEGNVLVNCVAL